MIAYQVIRVTYYKSSESEKQDERNHSFFIQADSTLWLFIEYFYVPRWKMLWLQRTWGGISSVCYDGKGRENTETMYLNWTLKINDYKYVKKRG